MGFRAEARRAPNSNAFKRPYGTRRFLYDVPGTEVPGYFHSFLRKDPNWNSES